ncbi:MAG: tail fiber protein [Proteobacteria bacterium]|nr:tail fiber protein [Pseudomonadota bacterium]
MAEPFVGEIKMTGFNFAPRNWALCDGQTMQINQNQALYALLGNSFGGDGRSTFKLPDLRGRTPIGEGNDGMGQYYTRGQAGGQEVVALTEGNMPTHTHEFRAGIAVSDKQNLGNKSDRILAKSSGLPAYGPAANLTQMNPSTITKTGGNSFHENVQPSLVINFVIALQGTYPSRN